ncbi:hypothetical protein CC2G_011064 [Coprinopsis cinerea AmutBmut pab1-1]|nr:hypothetical protein CC2G_011064 [Coprinopsis cinerea AmutBmut pab1-1]
MIPRLIGHIRAFWGGRSPSTRKYMLYFSSLLVVSGLVTVFTAAPSMSMDKSDDPVTQKSAEVSLSAEVVAIDLEGRTITMDWFPFLGILNCTEIEASPFEREVYLHRLLLDESTPTSRDERPDLVFVMNSTELCPVNLWPGEVSFRTVTKLYPVDSRRVEAPQTASSSSQQRYPRERLRAIFDFGVIDRVSGRMTAPAIYNLTRPVLSFNLAQGPSYIAPGPRSGDSKLQVTVFITRSSTVRIFVYATAVMSWLVTIGFLAIVAASCVYANHQIYAEMFVVPIGALFAFTSIRSNLPGAPQGFGTVLDTFSIVPVLIITSVSSFVLLISVLYKRIREAQSAERLSKESAGPDIKQELTPVPDSAPVLPVTSHRRTSSSSAGSTVV